MRHYLDNAAPSVAPMTLMEADAWFSPTDEELDKIADMPVGDTLTLASGESIKRVE